MNARWLPSFVAGTRIQASVDADAIAHNLAVIRAHAGAASPAPRIWATAKADAYGHGLSLAMPGLGQADGIAVQQLPEAHACRAAGWQGPILVYGGLLAEEDIAQLDLADLHLVISHEAQLDWLASCPPRPDAPAVWLRYDGDIRLAGFSDEAYARAYARCTALAAQHRIGAIGHLSHYARAEDEDGVAEADARFRQVIAGLPGLVSTCNSAALLRHPGHVCATDWVRPGIALYGVSPLAGIDGPALGLRPAMTLTARLFAVQTLPAGASIGYRAAFVASRDMRVGLVSCGYGDGYPRHAGTGTPVLAGGRRTRLLGRVTMDVMIIDLDGIDHAAPGMPVVLWGTPDLPVETVAASAGTIAAELLTGLTARVPFTARD
ncbi:alanine racemase [Bordetella genomosp. 13]|uniref:Alanine racemase n=1 Tax=Bordetella genomosp. 13 TaxID=463040 RepID=A0A1W6Z877_9BORD|nr:alanine racemase [Bordetella genomosp. 13]ARP93583.1 alanine racemase [Bordetella genomosp. 13]